MNKTTKYYSAPDRQDIQGSRGTPTLVALIIIKMAQVSIRF